MHLVVHIGKPQEPPIANNNNSSQIIIHVCVCVVLCHTTRRFYSTAGNNNHNNCECEWVWMYLEVCAKLSLPFFSVFVFVLFFIFSLLLFLKCVKNAQAQVKWALARFFPSPLSFLIYHSSQYLRILNYVSGFVGTLGAFLRICIQVARVHSALRKVVSVSLSVSVFAILCEACWRYYRPFFLCATEASKLSINIKFELFIETIKCVCSWLTWDHLQVWKLTELSVAFPKWCLKNDSDFVFENEIIEDPL